MIWFYSLSNVSWITDLIFFWIGNIYFGWVGNEKPCYISTSHKCHLCYTYLNLKTACLQDRAITQSEKMINFKWKIEMSMTYEIPQKKTTKTTNKQINFISEKKLPLLLGVDTMNIIQVSCFVYLGHKPIQKPTYKIILSKFTYKLKNRLLLPLYLTIKHPKAMIITFAFHRNPPAPVWGPYPQIFINFFCHYF